ncbi:LOW QUALITY PROTEIN: ganglioside GM2 activator [Phycodurus eques]|uniref:LOW QUALITY PROTEIN: ganglioside GM2 activator n=1 Tax=Phycodurus eques TaxID=693459 RepID=UPI002ACEB2B3|nr:LOW QUALITY PROTEIN: ganglioside GM2 activator [Phycodurus eques]
MKPIVMFAVTLSMLGVVVLTERQHGWKRINKVKVSGFAWENCGKPDAAAVLKTLSVSPDPISIPGDLTASASGSTSVELRAPLNVNVTVEKEVAGFWVKIPCLDDLGSCHYPDACDLLNQLIPPGQDCPEPLHTYGLPCRCPFKPGSYVLPQSDFFLPFMDVPLWLSNGDYRLQGVLGDGDGEELGCLKVALSLHSEKTYAALTSTGSTHDAQVIF